MRLAAHHSAVINPIRENPSPVTSRQASSSSPSTAPLRLGFPTLVSSAPATSPFASVFQSFNQTTALSNASAKPTTTAALTNTAPTIPVSTTAGAKGTPVTFQTRGISTLVTAITNGSFQPTNVTDPSKLQESTPAGTDTMPSFYYASDQTAAQLAQMLGGTVVQMPPFGVDKGWSEPNANFIQLPNGQTFNAADVAYYARSGIQGSAQLTADITQTINEGAAWTNYYQNGGQIPSFATGYVGPPISGMTYASSMIGPDGNVINPAMQNSSVNT